MKTFYETGEAILRTLRRVCLEKSFNETHEDMRMKFSYRTDPATLRKFHRKVLTKCFHEEDMEDEQEFLDRVKADDYVVVLAEEGREILGGIVIEHSWSTGKKIMLVAWVAVNEKHRGRNIGTLLIEEALSYAKSQGALVLLGEVENPEMFEEGDSAYGNPVKRVRFYSRFGCQRLEVPYVVPSHFGEDGLEWGMMLTLFPLSDEQVIATEIIVPEFTLFMEEFVETEPESSTAEVEAAAALVEAVKGTVRLTPFALLL